MLSLLRTITVLCMILLCASGVSYSAEERTFVGIPVTLQGLHIHNTCILEIGLRLKKDGSIKTFYFLTSSQMASEISRFICKNPPQGEKLLRAIVRCTAVVNRISPEEKKRMLLPLDRRMHEGMYYRNVIFMLERLKNDIDKSHPKTLRITCVQERDICWVNVLAYQGRVNVFIPRAYLP